MSPVIELKPTFENNFDVYVNGWVIGYLQYVTMSKAWVVHPMGLAYRESLPYVEYKTKEEAQEFLVSLFRQRVKNA